VPYVSLFTNADDRAGDRHCNACASPVKVITTPYSFVATAHSLLWNGVEPVFVDIDPHTLTLDASRMSRLRSRRAPPAIMPVHVYGRPAARVGRTAAHRGYLRDCG
jgi:dTDP-4-amino-4,6-dideoxygalactose transaminase